MATAQTIKKPGPESPAKGGKTPTIVAPNPVSALYQGYNTFTSNAMPISPAVTGTPSSGAQTCGYKVSVCTDFESFLSALKVSVAVAGVFEAAAVSAKCDLVRTVQFSSYSVAVVVYSSQETVTTAQNVTMAPNVAPTSSLAVLGFFQKYGDSYVSQITAGGYYAAVYMFYAENQSQQTSVTASLSAKGIVDGAVISGSFSTSLQTSLSTSDTQTDTQQTMAGINMALPSAESVADMMTFAQNFTGLTLTGPAVTGYVTQGYELGNLVDPTIFAPVVTNRNLVLGNAATHTPGLSSIIGQLTTLQDMVSEIQNTYNVYNYTGDQALTSNSAQIQTDLTGANILLSNIATDPTQTYSLGTYPSLSYGEPNLNFTLNTWPTPYKNMPNGYGGTGGVPFCDANANSVYMGQYIQSIAVTGAAWINALQVTYASPNNQPNTITHGNTSGGKPCGTLTLQPDEVITSLFGSYGQYVNQLKIGASKHTGTYIAPPNPQGATVAEWSIAPGSTLLGFSGASGTYLNALAIVLAAFQPATWQQ